MGETIMDNGLGSTLDPSVQIKVRYDAASQTYEVFLPDGQKWQKIEYNSTTASRYVYLGSTVSIGAAKTNNQYSRLIDWFDGANSGMTAVGIPTPANAIPVSGTASYSGQILGLSSDYHVQNYIDGSIALSFDFGSGGLAGSITPNIQNGFDLGTINFRDTVYSTGDKTFSGQFDSDLAGLNSFNGQFAGPKAEELIGNFAFPYRSSIDQLIYQVTGAFIGKK